MHPGLQRGNPAKAPSGDELPRKRARRFRASRRLVIACLLAVALGGLLLAASIRRRLSADNLLLRELRLGAEDVDLIASRRSVYAEKDLPARATFSEFLEAVGLEAGTVEKIVADTRPVYNLGRVRAGNRVTIVRSGKGDLRAISYRIDLDRVLWIRRGDDRFHAEIKLVPYVVTVAGVAGQIRESLFQALAEQAEADQLALEIADIFGWDVDFSTDPQPGDTFEVLVEKKILHGELLGYGRVLAAQYRNAGRLFRAVLFRDPLGRPAYYAPDGKSLQKAFLRSPLKFGATVSSRFSFSRFHPILKRSRPHLGVDYRAPAGSAVQAVAEGQVVSAGWQGDGGKTVRLRHAKGYETYYLHLSRILVRPGQRVHQGQLIGATGSTGLSTGPHLDFRVTQHGKFRNFLALKLPPAQSVARKDWDEFVAARARLLDQLASLHAQQANQPAATALRLGDESRGK